MTTVIPQDEIGNNSTANRRAYYILEITKAMEARKAKCLDEALSREEIGDLSSGDRIVALLKQGLLDNLRVLYATHRNMDVLPGVVVFVHIFSDFGSGCCTYSIPKMAKFLSRTEEAVRLALKRAVDAGVLARQLQSVGGRYSHWPVVFRSVLDPASHTSWFVEAALSPNITPQDSLGGRTPKDSLGGRAQGSLGGPPKVNGGDPPKVDGDIVSTVKSRKTVSEEQSLKKEVTPPTPSASATEPGDASGVAGGEKGIDDLFAEDANAPPPTPKEIAARNKQRAKPLAAEVAAEKRREAHRAFEIYNEAAERFGFLLAKGVTEARLKRMEKRLEDIGGVDVFRKALWAIDKDEFLTGRIAKPGQSPFVLTLERLLSTDSGLSDVLARLIDLIDAPTGKPTLRTKRSDLKPDWWRGNESVMDELPLDFWREVLKRYANGRWPVELLGPEPWDADKCFIPRKLIEELDLRGKYPAPDEHRAN